MVEPIVIPRSEHPISRRDIDPDALKVLNRLREFNYVAYLVGGSVRDLLLGRRPKDFDIGTSAHPYEIKRLFRNCWIIGRRFRLAHVKFGPKAIEVATFRRHLPASAPANTGEAGSDAAAPREPAETDRLIHRDNTFGTPEEDAFRRDFTVNGLFYDIATFSIIDYVGGLADIRCRLVRCIGDPHERFQEDPVRMLRAVALASRLDFDIDPPVRQAIGAHRRTIARSAPARLLEEFLKILRSSASERTFRAIAASGLLEPIGGELHAGASDTLWRSLAALDRYRARFDSTPASLTNPILLGTLLFPLGLPVAGGEEPGEKMHRRDLPSLGILPLPRGDIERLRQILAVQRRLNDLSTSPRAIRALVHRGLLGEALTWLEIHGDAPETVNHWRGRMEAARSPHVHEVNRTPGRRRQRRRRRRYRQRAV